MIGACFDWPEAAFPMRYRLRAPGRGGQSRCPGASASKEVVRVSLADDREFVYRLQRVTEGLERSTEGLQRATAAFAELSRLMLPQIEERVTEAEEEAGLARSPAPVIDMLAWLKQEVARRTGVPGEPSGA